MRGMASRARYRRKRRDLDRVAAGERASEGAVPAQQLEVVRIGELAAPAARVRDGAAPAGDAPDDDAERALGPADEEQRRRVVARLEVRERFVARVESVDPAQVVRRPGATRACRSATCSAAARRPQRAHAPRSQRGPVAALDDLPPAPAAQRLLSTSRRAQAGTGPRRRGASGAGAGGSMGSSRGSGTRGVELDLALGPSDVSHRRPLPHAYYRVCQYPAVQRRFARDGRVEDNRDREDRVRRARDACPNRR